MKVYFSDTNQSYVENQRAYYPIEVENQAIRNLKSTSAFLWFYLIGHSDERPFVCRPADFSKDTGLSKTYSYRAVEEMIEQKYLVPIPYKEESYMFYETPKEEAE